MVDHVHHKNITKGSIRAAVLGLNDGLLTNLSLILGVVGGDFKPHYVKIAGFAGLLAGAFSMGVGEYISMKAQKELFEGELKKEETEIEQNPQAELEELIDILRSRGLSKELASEVAGELMRDNKTALETHAREELGIDPYNLGSPVAAALSSFFAFAIGAFVPLMAWFIFSGSVASILSLALSILVSFFAGFLLAYYGGNSKPRTIARQVILLLVASGVTFGLGHLAKTTL